MNYLEILSIFLNKQGSLSFKMNILLKNANKWLKKFTSVLVC